jgi:membrane protein DedA with SNARE-associated domain
VAGGAAPRWRWLDRAAGWGRALNARYGLAGVFVLAFVPNPVFKAVAATAGASRVSPARFLAAVTAGKLAKALVLAYAGHLAIVGG